MCMYAFVRYIYIIAPTRPPITHPTHPSPRNVMPHEHRVETVVGYWQRWMAKFPTVESLAAASDEEVNAVWAGLGYYRRARMLQQGARVVLEKHRGELPTTLEELLAIPGMDGFGVRLVDHYLFNLYVS